MVNWIKITIYFLVFHAVISCEKVIEIPLNEADQRIVIEAEIKDGIGNNYVLISKSGSVYNDEDFDKITDAIVLVKDDLENEYPFIHQENGRYICEDLEAISGRTYSLLVQAEGQDYQAVSQVMAKPKLDSLSYFQVTGQFGVPVGDTVNLISFHSVDNPDETNFYWMKIFRNEEPNTGYYLGDDQFINGEYFEAQFFGSEAKNGDTVLVEMISMDKANYDYFIGLSNTLTTGPFAVSPANPPTNISNNALGYFGAYATDTMSIIIPY